MIIRCLGGWAEGGEHAPATIGQKEPMTDPSPTDGCCDRCCWLLQLPITCRWCGEIPTRSGICLKCENTLACMVGDYNIELSVFRAGRLPITGKYDGAGVILRLRAGMERPEYCGFALRVVAGVPR